MSDLQNFFPTQIQELVNEHKNIFIITRHERTKKIFSAFNAKEIDNINNIRDSLIIGVLPIDLISQATRNNNVFINIGVDPEKFQRKFNIQYNPKTSEQVLSGLSDEEFVRLLRFIVYRKVEMTEIPITQFEQTVRNKKTFYNGSPIFKQSLQQLFNLQYVNNEKNAEIVLSPSETKPFYYIKVTDRNLIINTVSDFAEALKSGKIRVFYVVADAIVL